MAHSDSREPRAALGRKLAPAGLFALSFCVALVGAAASAGWASTAARPAVSAASAKAKIIADWQAFFSGKTPASRKIQLVQYGQAFAQVIKQQAGSIMAQSVAAKVSSVTLNKSMTQATVVYTITLGGSPALSNQKGTAIFQGGTWKVGARSFCGLLALEGSAKQVPVCKAK